jgi:hypothetical protein
MWRRTPPHTVLTASETMTDDQELAKLRESLRLCRLELAQVREESEPVLEELARLRRAEQKFIELSEQVVDLTRHQVPSMRGALGRLERRWKRPEATPEEERDIARLRASTLFDAAWYVREYPQTLRFGLSPELHYLRKGAKAGRNPGPNFDAAAYRAHHPEMPRKANPLLHYLDNRAASGTAR